MIPTWTYVSLAIVADGAIGLVAGLIPERWLARSRMPMLGFAAGVLLGTTFLDLLPEAMSQLNPAMALAVALGSLLTMILLEWTVGHRAETASAGRRLVVTLLGADAFHNAADGAAIAAAFVVSPRLGVVTTLAVIAHEVPEEVADYLVLRNAGLSKRRALVAMAAVQITAAIGAVVTLGAVRLWTEVSGVALAIAAGTFLHVAEVDLVPTVLTMVGTPRERVLALGALLFGVGVVLVGTLW